ncbi:MAG: endonuclease, partial [Methylococcales bacterium]|nr:endonuclease [Methylococcales bacterium]
MATAQLLYIENIISRQQDQVVQSLNFLMTVENLGFDKTVDILWAGEDGKWYTLAAKFHSMQGGGREYWMAGVQLNLSES